MSLTAWHPVCQRCSSETPRLYVWSAEAWSPAALASSWTNTISQYTCTARCRICVTSLCKIVYTIFRCRPFRVTSETTARIQRHLTCVGNSLVVIYFFIPFTLVRPILTNDRETFSYTTIDYEQLGSWLLKWEIFVVSVSCGEGQCKSNEIKIDNIDV